MKRKQQLAEVNGSDSRELRGKLNELRQEAFQLRFRGATEAMAKTARFRQIRREVARILTVLGARNRAQAAEGSKS